jgi:hypothetical protein
MHVDAAKRRKVQYGTSEDLSVGDDDDDLGRQLPKERRYFRRSQGRWLVHGNPPAYCRLLDRRRRHLAATANWPVRLSDHGLDVEAPFDE